MDLPPPMRLAIREAQKSTYRHQLGAVVKKSGRIIGRGYNQLRKHKFSDYYEHEHACHAEAASLLGIPGGSATGSTMYVARVNRCGQIRMSKPCASCFSLIKDLGVKKIVYTTNDGIGEMYCR